MVRRTPAGPVLVLCSDVALRESLRDLLTSDGWHVSAEPLAGLERNAVVVAASDAWPPGWSIGVLRSTFGHVPSIVLGGSPLGGDFIATPLQRGYYLQLPASPGEILELVGELAGD
ncbi:MAG: hypothetical protein M3R48_01650 [Candidatus Dormibacteraeota bacterium]|nr:hypothetical protein [Candidatus Dormibacteraeota bacterium]